MQMEVSFFIILVALNQQISVTASKACGPDQSEHDGSCYHFSHGKVNFDSSKSSCESKGMHLVYIGSEEEQVFLQNSLSGTDEKHWIGLSKLTWLDESSLTYNNFGKKKWAFDNKGTCFRMYHDTFWYDRGCSGTLLYICEQERGSSAACDSGQSEYDGSCYFFSPSESNFYSSKSSCEELEMHLVYIGSQGEQDFLVDKRPNASKAYWIGLSSVTWLDSSSLTYANFSYDSKAFDEEGSCFVIEPSKSFEWLDDNCADDHEHRYICEKEGGIQTSSVQHTTPGAITTSTVGSTPRQVTSPGTSSSTTQTDVATTSGSTQHTTAGSGVVSETTGNPTSTRPTSEATSSSTTGSTISEQTTQTTPATTTKHATQLTSTTTCSSKKDRGNSRSKSFKLLFNNFALIDARVRSSHVASSLIQCSQWCLRDTHCSCFTFISSEKVCLLGDKCPMFADIYEERHGAKTYSTVHEDRECFSEDDNNP